MANTSYLNSVKMMMNGVPVEATSVTMSWDIEPIYEMASEFPVGYINKGAGVVIEVDTPARIPYTSGESQLFSSRSLPRCRYCDLTSREEDRWCAGCGAPL